MSKKWSWKKILLILGGLILLAIIIGIIVALITNSESKSVSTGPSPPCKNIGDNCSNNLDCCSNYCNSANTCACKPDGKTCSSDDASNCCSNYCSDGKCICMPLNHRWCTDGICCGEAECKQVIEDSSFLVKKCCIPENKSCQIDSDCCTGNCQGNKTCGPPLQCNINIDTDPSLYYSDVNEDNQECLQIKQNLANGPFAVHSQKGKCTKDVMQKLFKLIPSNQADWSQNSCGSCSDKPSVDTLYKNCSSGKLYTPNPLQCDGNVYACTNHDPVQQSKCPCLYASTESSCNNMFTKWSECDKNTCEWRNIYSTTKPDPHCGGCSPYDM